MTLADRRGAGMLFGRAFAGAVCQQRPEDPLLVVTAEGLQLGGCAVFDPLVADAEARDLLEPLDDDRKWNTLAVSYYMTGDPDKAMACFERAAADGNAEAQRNIDAIRKLRKE